MVDGASGEETGEPLAFFGVPGGSRTVRSVIAPWDVSRVGGLDTGEIFSGPGLWADPLVGVRVAET